MKGEFLFKCGLLGMFMLLMILPKPALGSFCCGTEVDANDKKCYPDGSGDCCNGFFSDHGCWNFTVLALGPGNYIVAEPTSVIVKIDNYGFYGDLYTITHEIINPIGGPSTNPNLIHVNMNDADELTVAARSSGFVTPLITVLADTNDCIRFNATSQSDGVMRSDMTCVNSVEASISLSEFSYVGLLSIFALAGLIIILKKRGGRT